jgi:hypothetical protein
MRQQMIRPKLVFLTRPRSANLLIKNVGEGAAINVSVDHVTDEQFEMVPEPEHIPVLEKGQEMELALRPAAGSYKPDMSIILDDASVSLRLKARYLDVDGREFRTSTAVGAGAKTPFIKDEKRG